MTRADLSLRSKTMQTYESFVESLQATITGASTKIAETSLTISTQERMLVNLKSSAKGGISLKTIETSAFDFLQALSVGNYSVTQCPICLEHLGQGNSSLSSDCGDVPTIYLNLIAMTKCGHLYCRQCLADYVSKNPNFTKCPTCRKALYVQKDVVIVDPTKNYGIDDTRREAAKISMQSISQKLIECNGLLPSELWEQLYLAVDLPSNQVDTPQRDHRVPAIPGHFLAHLQHCTGLDILLSSTEPKMKQYVPADQTLSSKVKMLLRDLPQNELSVVFSSCINTIKHLQYVFHKLGIGYRSLCTGGSSSLSTEKAVSEWQMCAEQRSTVHCPTSTTTTTTTTTSDDDTTTVRTTRALSCPVLLVQSGAAACGLTLTAACKIFIMEPFLRLEEEQQAYARCHRLGQTKPVHVKVYYTPVSIESRLLDWRERTNNNLKSSQSNNSLPDRRQQSSITRKDTLTSSLSTTNKCVPLPIHNRDKNTCTQLVYTSSLFADDDDVDNDTTTEHIL